MGIFRKQKGINKTYRLAGNDWYLVAEDEEKIMLVDTDCKIGSKALITPWSDGYCRSKDGENGQYILDYVNNIADKYFNGIKYAILPRAVEAGTCKLEDVYMWPMSRREFIDNKVVGGKIVENSHGFVWTRTFSSVNFGGTFSSVNFGGHYRHAWFVCSTSGALSNHYVSDLCRVAPAFYLRKAAIDHISEDGEIVLKHTEPVQDENDYIPFNLAEELGKLSTETEKLHKMLEEAAAKRKEEAFCRKLMLAIASMDESEQELLEKTINMLIHKIHTF